MKKIKKALSLLIILTVLATLTGCDWFAKEPDQSAEEIVQTAFSNMYNFKTYTYEYVFDGEINSDNENYTFDIAMSGINDMNDPTKPKVSMDIDGSFTMDDIEEQNIQAEIIYDTSDLHFNVKKISDFDGMITEEMTAPFLGKWYKMALPEDAMMLFIIPRDDEGATEKEKEMKELMTKTMMFKNLEYVNTEGGSYHYEGELDKEAIVELMIKMAELNEAPMTEGDILELKESLNVLEMDVELWIDKELMIINKMTGEILFDAGTEGKMVINFKTTMDDFNKDLKIEYPSDVTDFDPMMLFGFMLMGGGLDMDMSDEEFGAEMDFNYDFNEGAGEFDAELYDDLEEMESDLEAMQAELETMDLDTSVPTTE